ncbi:MAG TPA: LysM peptidoglycan-binding domain-containing protein [Crenotrichaceae bacterium]|nr:LysM peptidoglycan-binding domain-containing protein [Crenotrichaceae bacterium]
MDNKEYKIISTQNTLLFALIVINLILGLLALYLFLRDDESPQEYASDNTATQKNSQLPAGNQTLPSNSKTTDDDAQPDSGITKSDDVITQSINEMGKLSSKDSEYVKALDDLQKEVDSQLNSMKPTIKKVVSQKAKKTSGKPPSDFINKIDVSKIATTATNSGKPGLSAQIAQIVSAPEQTMNTSSTPAPAQTNDSYLKKLKTESAVRANEMRTIKVVEGDNLWNIAVRAYGNGHEYPRIFKANPSLKDPDRIEVGMLLRVPL